MNEKLIRQAYKIIKERALDPSRPSRVRVGYTHAAAILEAALLGDAETLALFEEHNPYSNKE